MKAVFERANQLLAVPLSPGPRGLLVIAAVLLLPVYLMPLWKLTMFAPQYPDGLRLSIYSYKLVGGNGGQDVKEINVLNHYIGMRDLAAADFTEFKWIPFVVGALGLLFLRCAVLGNLSTIVDMLVLYTLFRALLALVLRIQALPIRTRSGADGGGQGSRLHAAALRPQEAGEFRGLLLPGSRVLRPAGGRSGRRRRGVLAWREARAAARREPESPDDPAGAPAPGRGRGGGDAGGRGLGTRRPPAGGADLSAPGAGGRRACRATWSKWAPAPTRET